MARFADIKAGYLYLTVDGIEYRVFVERAGKGAPVLLQHTAGSDARQWRHVLEDPDYTENFELITYDLPYHGKSLPPTSVRYWEQEYLLTKEWFMEFVVQLSRALELADPIFVGCSIGGHLAMDLALHYPGFFRAVVGMEAAAKSDAPSEVARLLWHPRISDEMKGALMMTVCSPTAPEAYRRETAWCYTQSSPPVFRGDGLYYTLFHDLRETAHLIDTSKTAVYILNGDYDWSGHVAAGEELAKSIKGAHWTRMVGLGHFPMSEDPEQFKTYLLPILEEIRSGS
jgi:pimeloyl-ACP methyl ester carboxylesterase